MPARQHLKVGMTPLEVCHTLLGWRFQQAQVIGTPARFYCWDFTSPDGIEVVRVTFDDTGLLAWGKPSDAVDQSEASDR
jgi:hypothetical protein